MPPFIINVAGAAGAFTGGWLRSFRQKCPLSAGGRCFSNGEPHRVLPADRKAAGMHSLKGRTARSRCMRTVRIFGKTGGKRPVRYRAAIHVNGRSFRRWAGWRRAAAGGLRPGRFWALRLGKRPFVHTPAAPKLSALTSVVRRACARRQQCAAARMSDVNHSPAGAAVRFGSSCAGGNLFTIVS